MIKLLLKIQDKYAKDQTETAQTYFAMTIKEIFFNMQIEGFHQAFKDMSMTNSNKPEVIGYKFTKESSI